MNPIKLSTSVNIPKSEINITHRNTILLIGSCFTVSIGQKLLANKLDVIINPHGIIYNPISVFKSLDELVKNKMYSDNVLFKDNEKWLSFNHHGSFSSLDKDECLAKINTSINNTHQQFRQTKTIFITLGSAWVYEYPNVGIVANCHKIPNKNFSKRLLSVKEILASFDKIKEALKGVNIIFTVSPVRHVSDGLHENNLSKATLHLAINNMVAQHANCSYFPAYELLIDELRDYRFFKDDLIHPTELAVNYIWEKFIATYCNAETLELMAAIGKVRAAVQHRPFNFKSEKHQQFISQQIQVMEKLSKQYPFLNFEEEKIKIQKN